jgi:hypothetical protein
MTVITSTVPGCMSSGKENTSGGGRGREHARANAGDPLQSIVGFA